MMSRKTKVSKDNCLMNGTKKIDGFQLHDNSTFNEKVDSIAAFKLSLFVNNRDTLIWRSTLRLPKS